ncbi:hypothetical protein [Pararhizobium sp. O133]|uniref:hypothetical protein n=1 Tax=Pararhizobium sp. O133 TaxID=3449278 RepID=UPI003F688B5B
MPVDIITLGKYTVEFLAAAATVVKETATASDRASIGKVLDALRELYFYDDRTLSILDRTIAGEQLTSEEVDRAHRGFNASQKKIDDALNEIYASLEKPHRALSVRAYNKLRGLSQGKSDVRMQIDYFLYELGEPVHTEEDRQRRIALASEIREQIRDINGRIDLIDESLRSNR